MTITEQALERGGILPPGFTAARNGTVQDEYVTSLAGDAAVSPEAMKPPGVPVPDDKAAVAMFTAHRLDEILYQLAHASERMRAARAASGDLRAYHSARIDRHLQHALESGHALTENIRGHYPAEAGELERVKQAIGLAKSLTPDLKANTTAHLLETSLHEMTHGARHAAAMLDTEPDDVWEFNADHCEKHLGGAVEHAGKLRQHFADNYPAEARWLDGLDDARAPAEDEGGKQHARYAKRDTPLATITMQALEMGETISGQALLAGHPKAGPQAASPAGPSPGS